MALANAAIEFHPDGFTTSGPRLMGREAAGEGFLAAFLRHAAADAFYCQAASREHFEVFRQRALAARGDEFPVDWISPISASDLAGPGCLFRPDPVIGPAAWQRRAAGETTYSVCGITHTICSASVMDAIGALAIAPLHPWDAVICTSSAVKTAVDGMLERWIEYLKARLGAAPPLPVELPVIPLGVDCDALADGPDAGLARQTMRHELAAKPDEVVVLYVGRLSFHAKAHPLPLYLALEEAVRRTSKPVLLALAGWFANDAIRAEFMAGARQFCPSVRLALLDGRVADIRRRVWFAADIFTSLADNIQETFGLTPIEAMAAGLPVVVSDWNGYRDTVRQGIDGVRVSTVLAPPGAGEELALRYAAGADTYDFYVGAASQCAAVDVGACADAFERLFVDAGLRRRMGEAGRAHARADFDWRVIVRRYQELWHELGERRRAAHPPAGDCPRYPLRDDPFAVFGHYATRQLTPDAIVAAAPGAAARLEIVNRAAMMNFAASLLATSEEAGHLLALLSRGPCHVEALLSDCPPERRHAWQRTLAWMLKGGIVELSPS